MVSTKTLDHLVYLTPSGELETTTRYFRDSLGFNVITGGTHADGLTANSLVILADGVYLELIHFTKPVEDYPPGSYDRRKRESHRWANKPPGFVDYAFLGNGSNTTRISDIINDRARSQDLPQLYGLEVEGGRERPDGVVLQWLISAPLEPPENTLLPFFCGDVTARDRRVQVDPPSNTAHDNGATGIAHVKIVTSTESLPSLQSALTSVVGAGPDQIDESSASWSSIDHPVAQSTPDNTIRRSLVITAPQDEDQRQFLRAHGAGVFEVGFFYTPRNDKDNQRDETRLPHEQKFVWSRS